jgi:hypothetical protein
MLYKRLQRVMVEHRFLETQEWVWELELELELQASSLPSLVSSKSFPSFVRESICCDEKEKKKNNMFH